MFGPRYERFSSNFKEVKFVRSPDSGVATDAPTVSGMVSYMNGFAWDVLANENEKHDTRARLITDLIAGLSEFVALEPRVPISDRCKSAPELSPIDCAAFPDGL